MSDKGFEQENKMSVEYVNEAKGMAETILQKTFRGPGDTIEAAMYRAEQKYGVSASWLHRLRYREIKDMPVSAYGAIARAYMAATAATDRLYEDERGRHAPDSKITRLADFVAGEKISGNPEWLTTVAHGMALVSRKEPGRRENTRTPQSPA